MTRQEALAAGAKRYHGKVCAKHPELGGERGVASCTCVGCERARAREKMRERRKDPDFCEQDRARVREGNRERRKDPDFCEQERERSRERMHKKWITDPEYRMRKVNSDGRRRRMARIARLDKELNELWAS